MDLNLESTIGFQGIFEPPPIICNFDRYLHFSDKKMQLLICLSTHAPSLFTQFIKTLKFTEVICNCQRVLEIISIVTDNGRRDDTFSEVLNFISRQMKITLDYPSKFLLFFFSISIAVSSSLIPFSSVFTSFLPLEEGRG